MRKGMAEEPDSLNKTYIKARRPAGPPSWAIWIARETYLMPKGYLQGGRIHREHIFRNSPDSGRDRLDRGLRGGVRDSVGHDYRKLPG